MSAPFEQPLGELLHWFFDVTTHPHSVGRGLAELRSSLAPGALDPWVKGGLSETAGERLEIYHHGYFARLTECLQDDYPALEFALGNREFGELCHAYIVECPSRQPNLNRFGAGLSGFLQHFERALASFFVELAQLEWALVQAVHATKSAPVSWEAMAHVGAQNLNDIRFIPSESLQLFEFRYPVNAFLQAFFDECSVAIPEPFETHVAVVRADLIVWRMDLTRTQARLLTRLMHREPLGAALRDLEASPAEVQSWFADWAKLGVFSGVEFSCSPST